MPLNMQARIHGRAIWSADVERHGTTLVTRGPVALDFGACGKGYLVDLLAGMLGDGAGHPQPIQYVIDAGGDLLVHTDEPITIALEDPADPANAVGTVEISHGAFCASSPAAATGLTPQVTNFTICSTPSTDYRLTM